MYHLRYLEYEYYLDFGDILFDSERQSATMPVVEGHDVEFEISREIAKNGPVISKMRILRHSITLRKENGDWKIVSDNSIEGPPEERTEFVSPICRWEDIETVQELVRKLRAAGAKAHTSCGVHVHIGRGQHTPRTLRNLVNLVNAKEDLLTQALGISPERRARWCQAVDPDFLARLNRRKPTTDAAFADAVLDREHVGVASGVEEHRGVERLDAAWIPQRGEDAFTGEQVDRGRDRERHHTVLVAHDDVSRIDHHAANRRDAVDDGDDVAERPQLVFQPLARESLARIEHVRVDGKVISLGEGTLAAADAADRRIVIRRFFRGGRYDGLDLPIEEGDYALTECREGDMFVRHTYYSRKGVSKGVYVNINTPVELYPWGVRYVDLEIDVVRREGGEPFAVDRDKLQKITLQGHISPALEERASEVAERMIAFLRANGDR